MSNEVVSRADWLAARAALLKQEKTHTQARAALALARQQLPWVAVTKDYVFEGSAGRQSLAELFNGHGQLAIYHFMLGPGWEAPCPGCTSWAHALNGTTDQFANADARLIVVSRAPFAQLAAERERQGWSFDWLSSFDSDFNYDYYASSTQTEGTSSAQVGGRSGATGEIVEFDRGENHGVSVFARNAAGEVFHTYSAYNRGIEALDGAFGYFDLLPQGRKW